MRLLQELDWLEPEYLAARLAAVVARPPSAERDLEAALLAIGAGRFDEADTFAESAYAATPADPYAAYACGMTRIQNGEWARALEPLLKVPVGFERSGEVAVLTALALFEAGRPGDAERIAAAFTGADDETHGTLCALRGRCALARGANDAAAALFDEALRFAPRLEWARTLRAGIPGASAGSVVAVVI